MLTQRHQRARGALGAGGMRWQANVETPRTESTGRPRWNLLRFRLPLAGLRSRRWLLFVRRLRSCRCRWIFFDSQRLRRLCHLLHRLLSDRLFLRLGLVISFGSQLSIAQSSAPCLCPLCSVYRGSTQLCHLTPRLVLRLELRHLCLTSSHDRISRHPGSRCRR